MLKPKSTRFFAQKYYAKSKPFLDAKHTLLCLQRTKNEEGQSFIDVYDCSSEDFWTDEAVLDPTTDPRYKFSFDMSSSEDDCRFESIKFSSNNKYATIRCTDRLLIYDLEIAEEAQVSEDDGTTKRVSADEGKEFELVDTTTYDRILGHYIDEEDFSMSWIVLQSSNYGSIHLISLEAALKSHVNKAYAKTQRKEENKNDEQKKSLGGNFISKTLRSLLFKVLQGEQTNFWDEISTKFSRDGSKAVI